MWEELLSGALLSVADLEIKEFLGGPLDLNINLHRSDQKLNPTYWSDSGLLWPYIKR